MVLIVARLNAGVILVATASVALGRVPLPHHLLVLGSRHCLSGNNSALDKPNVRTKA